jgi:hypothetical protein
VISSQLGLAQLGFVQPSNADVILIPIYPRISEVGRGQTGNIQLGIVSISDTPIGKATLGFALLGQSQLGSSWQRFEVSTSLALSYNGIFDSYNTLYAELLKGAKSYTLKPSDIFSTLLVESIIRCLSLRITTLSDNLNLTILELLIRSDIEKLNKLISEDYGASSYIVDSVSTINRLNGILNDLVTIFESVIGISTLRHYIIDSTFTETQEQVLALQKQNLTINDTLNSTLSELVQVLETLQILNIASDSSLNYSEFLTAIFNLRYVIEDDEALNLISVIQVLQRINASIISDDLALALTLNHEAVTAVGRVNLNTLVDILSYLDLVIKIKLPYLYTTIILATNHLVFVTCAVNTSEILSVAINHTVFTTCDVNTSDILRIAINPGTFINLDVSVLG